jgi:beta-galactosidase
VTAAGRTDGQRDYIFLLNFTSRDQHVDLGNTPRIDQITGKPVAGQIVMPGYGVLVLSEPSLQQVR